jgi:hypothetical protein
LWTDGAQLARATAFLNSAFVSLACPNELHRGGWYTAHWVDKLLFPASRASVAHIINQFQDLHVGDFIPDGAPETECGFVVEELEAPRLLVLHSNSHLPLEWRRTGKASIDWTWVFSVVPLDSGDRTRFIFRWRAATKPWWLTVGTWAVIVPADFIMSRDMLQGVKRRAGARLLTQSRRPSGVETFLLILPAAAR